MNHFHRTSDEIRIPAHMALIPPLENRKLGRKIIRCQTQNWSPTHSGVVIFKFHDERQDCPPAGWTSVRGNLDAAR